MIKLFGGSVLPRLSDSYFNSLSYCEPSITDGPYKYNHYWVATRMESCRDTATLPKLPDKV